MGALERFDDWADGLDERLDASSPGGAPALEDVYGPEILAAIDGGRSVERKVSRVWGGATAGALTLGSLTGVRDELDADGEAVIEIDEAPSAHRLEAVSVHLVWGDPAAGVAVVRPWLLGT